MSSYPLWWDQTITVYNKVTDTQTRVVTWHKHTIPNCFWHTRASKVQVGEVMLETDNIVCRIPKQKNFLEQYAWVNLTDEEKSDYITLGIGDIVVKGGIAEEIDEYTQGKRSTDLIAKYKRSQGCFEIQKCSFNVSTGMLNPHYHISGV
jgi:hypothetical protein